MAPLIVPSLQSAQQARIRSACAIADPAAWLCAVQGAGIVQAERIWWVWEDLNFRPHPYQGCALTN